MYVLKNTAEVMFLDASWVGGREYASAEHLHLHLQPGILAQPAVVVMVVGSAPTAGLPGQCGTGCSTGLGRDPLLW